MADDPQYDITNLRAQALLSTFGMGGGPTSPLLNPAFSNMGQGDPSSVIQGDPSQSITGLPPTDPAALMNPAFKAQTKSMFTPNLKTDAEDKFNELLAKYPQHTPASLGRTIVAALAGFKGGPDASQKIMDQPFAQAEADWKNQAGPAYQSANLERQGNINERQIAGMQNTAQINQQRADDLARKNDQANQIAQGKLSIAQALANGDTFDTKGQYVIVLPKDGSAPYNSGVLTTNFDPMQIHQLDNASREKVAAGHDTTSIQRANIAAEARKYGVDVGAQTKLASGDDLMKPTVQTKNLAQASVMLLPTISDVREMAKQMNERGGVMGFDPVMSRIRHYAESIGTTGSPQDIAKSLVEFKSALDNDPTLHTSDDYLLGEFTTRLGDLAIRSARALGGGSSGGGGMAMVNLAKGLLTDKGTLDMFLGRLAGLEKEARKNALGPGSAATAAGIPTGKKTNADVAIENALKDGAVDSAKKAATPNPNASQGKLAIADKDGNIIAYKTQAEINAGGGLSDKYHVVK